MIKVLTNVARWFLGLLFVGAVLSRLVASSQQLSAKGFLPAAQSWLDVAIRRLQTLHVIIS